MKYYNAQKLLPEPLLREVQSYVQGGYIYVPSPSQPRRAWGEVSGSRRELDRRNREIVSRYRAGARIDALAESYHLSEHTIRKIIYRK